MSTPLTFEDLYYRAMGYRWHPSMGFVLPRDFDERVMRVLEMYPDLRLHELYPDILKSTLFLNTPLRVAIVDGPLAVLRYFWGIARRVMR